MTDSKGTWERRRGRMRNNKEQKERKVEEDKAKEEAIEEQ